MRTIIIYDNIFPITKQDYLRADVTYKNIKNKLLTIDQNYLLCCHAEHQIFSFGTRKPVSPCKISNRGKFHLKLKLTERTSN
jgi:hypothetical protein